MKSIKKFNSLNGKKITRTQLADLKASAEKDGSLEVVTRISKILDKYPDFESFEVTIRKPIKTASGLGAPRHSGLEKIALDECGRLKPGFRYLKGGQVEKVEKKESKKQVPAEKELPAKSVVKPQKKKAAVNKNPDPNPKKIATQVFEKKSFAPEEWVQADTRKTTNLIKKYLKEKYGINVKVRSDFYSGGSSLDISYTMGTDPAIIDKELGRLQHGSFNGMEDIYEYSDISERGIILDGYKLDTYKYVDVKREIPDEIYIKLATLLSGKLNLQGLKPFDGTKSDLHRYLPELNGFSNTWANLVYRYVLKGLNFATQDPDKIADLELHGQFREDSFYLTYKIKGDNNVYDTRKPEIFSTKMVKEKKIVQNLIRLIDYGKNNIAVIGLTGEIKDELFAIGGIENKDILFENKKHEGFVFHKKDLDQVSNILIDYSNENQPGLNGTFRRKILKKKIMPGKDNGLGMPANTEVSEIIFHEPAPIPIQVIPEQIPVKKMVVQKPEETKPGPVPSTSAVIAKSKNPLVKSMAERSGSGEFYELSGGLGGFIGRIEKKPHESVVITLDAPQGAGKTRLLFQIMNLVASHGMRVLYLSFEEHPDSDLFTLKRDQYIDPANHDKIDTIAELPNGYSDFKSLVPDYDWIFTDSFGKKELLCDGRFDLDKDQRKAFDGKVFVDIYQRTQDNKMRGGSLAQFDADAVMKIDKDSTGNYKNNIAYFDKHRYHTRPLNELRYNIFHQELEGTYAELSDGDELGTTEITEII